MDDEGEIIYSTPLPGASPAPASIPTPGSAASAPQPPLLPPQPAVEKPADYVYYERRPDDLSSEARVRATAAKVKLQSHYRIALETAIDLNVRCVCGIVPPWPGSDSVVGVEVRSSRGPSRAYRRSVFCEK